MLLHDLLDGKTARVMGGFRMIGNSEIYVASIARRLSHGVQRIDAIGQVRMGVQNAADILVANQLRQLALQRLLDFALAFAQLGRNERQPERCIDILLLFSSDDLVSPLNPCPSSLKPLVAARARKPSTCCADPVASSSVIP